MLKIPHYKSNFYIQTLCVMYNICTHAAEWFMSGLNTSGLLLLLMIHDVALAG